jgi:hypothetical protein
MTKSLPAPHRPQYTAEQIHNLADSGQLPGFTDQGDVFSILEAMPTQETCWQTVLSTTVVTRLENELHILTGKRIAEGNTTHVDVASTPTIRVPAQDAGSLIASSVPFCLAGNIDPLHPFVSDSLRPSMASVPDSADVLASKVGILLAQKLGLASELERARQPIGRASVARCIAGFSYLKDDATGAALYEPLIMLGTVVGLDPETAAKIPERTDSYSHLGWVPITTYAHGVATKNLLEVMPLAKPEDELEVCVRGLCNATSAAIVSDPKELQIHLTEDGIVPF